MEVLPVEGGRTNPPTQPAQPPASSSNGPPTCDQPWSRVHLRRLVPRRTPAPSRRACGLLTESPAPPRHEEGCPPAPVAHPSAQAQPPPPSPPRAPIATSYHSRRSALRAHSLSLPCPPG